MAIVILPRPIDIESDVITDCMCDWKLISPRNPNHCKRCGGFINFKVGI